MSASEIKSFEDLWQYLMKIFYAILDFFRKADKEPVDVGSNTVRYDSIVPVYPTK